jgi:SagB-type dehydrogenase family enzyme
MKFTQLFLALFLMTSVMGFRVAQAADETVIALPAPKTDGKVSVEKALQHRRSLRNPQETPLSLGEVGQLCWAAQGVTDDKGHRTAPSAMAAYPLDLYVIAGAVKGFAPGFYQYVPATHSLRLVSGGDKRSEFVEKTIGQTWIVKAPVLFIITGSSKGMSRIKNRAEEFTAVEAGLASQGFFLQAEALGLGSTYVGGFKPAEVKKYLGLKSDDEIFAVLPVGKKP